MENFQRILRSKATIIRIIHIQDTILQNHDAIICPFGLH